MKIGSVIAEIRKKKEINQGAFAKLIGISQTALSQIETGQSQPNSGTLKKICTSLGITEPMLYLAAISENDVPENRRKTFQMLYPDLQQLVYEIAGVDNGESAI